MNDLPKDILLKYHEKQMQFPEYVEGWNAAEEDENPYKLDVELNLRMIRLSLKEGPLTEDECESLRSMKEEMDATPWSRWSFGHFTKHYKSEE